jgi:PAS domain S-box-containing protein
MDESDLSFLDTLPQLIGMTGPDLRSRFVNSAYADFLGKPRRDLKGASLSELWGTSLIDESMPFIKRALAGEALSFTKRITTAEGETRLGRVNLVPRPEGGYVAVIEDIGATERSDGERGNLIHELDHRVNNILQILQSIIALETQAADARTRAVLAALKSRLDALALSYEHLRCPEPARGWQAAAVLDKIAAAIGPGSEAVSEADPDIFIPPPDLDAFVFIATELARWATAEGKTVSLEARRCPEGIELSVHNGGEADLTRQAGAAGIALVESFAKSRRAGPLRGGSRLSVIFPKSAESPMPADGRA